MIGHIIHEFAIIDANSIVLPGIKIGCYALIGARSVIVKDVPDYAIIVGNPGRVIGDIRKMNHYEI